jgi:signal transduction histidine kinase
MNTVIGESRPTTKGWRFGGPVRRPRPALSPASHDGVHELRRLERDLHDGVQNELVALIIGLHLVTEHPETPPALANELARLEALSVAALDSVRNIARGIYPPTLATFGVAQALRDQVARAPIDVRVVGDAPRSIDEAEAAVYFSCSEAIQNVVKHAGSGARATVELGYGQGTLDVRITDDGRGFNPARTTGCEGLNNIRDRIEALDGSFDLFSGHGRGTVLAISIPWRARLADSNQGPVRFGSGENDTGRPRCL